MSKYRLEMWFDMGATPTVLNWGVVKSNDNDDHLVGGGSPLAKNTNAAGRQAVLIPDGLESSFDIYLFDASRDGVARDLQWIQVDYTYAGTTNAASPINWAAPLREGMTGTAFHSDPAGFAGSGPEEKVWSTAPPPINTQRRWSMGTGYQGLSDGHFSFCATVRVGPPGTTTGGTTLQFDPEMDVEN